jgi:hypothetical protein
MPGHVVIIVPSQGDSVGAFADVARKLNHELYGGKATIVKTTLTEPAGSTGSVDVGLQIAKHAAFAFPRTHNLSRVITISHATGEDGPNLALTDNSIDVFHHQPWGLDTADHSKLSAEGQAFWKSVGNAMRADGKNIMLGCKIGHGAHSYAGLVASATGKRVFASTQSFGAGDAKTAMKHVQAIESGHVLSPMKRFKP